MLTAANCSPTAANLQQQLAQLGIAAAVEGGRLRFRPAPPPALRDAIVRHREELIHLYSCRQEPESAEVTEARALIQQLAQQRAQIVAMLFEMGERRGWPPLQLEPWMRLEGGPDAWRRYLGYPGLSPRDLARLLDALARPNAWLGSGC